MAAKHLVLSCFLITVVWHASAWSAGQRPFVVRDAVEMAYFGNVFTSTLTRPFDDGAVAPDSRFAIKITHRGLLPEGVTEGTIWLFDVNQVIGSIEDADAPTPAPVALVRMSAAANGYSTDFTNRGNILLHPKWSADGKSVYFLGRDGRENRRLFKVDVDSQKLLALSPESKDVFAYSVAGPRAAFLAGRNIDAEGLWQTSGAGIDDVVVGTGTALMPLMFPNFVEYANVEPLTLDVWRVHGESAEPVNVEASGRPLQVTSKFDDADISISPDGKQAVVVVADFSKQNASSSTSTYRIIDLESGAFRDSSNLDATDLAWTPFMPGTRAEPEKLCLTVSESLNQPPVLIATKVDTGESRKLFDPNPQLADIELLPVSIMEWEDQHGRTIVGGLIKPAGFEVGRRYPLVIQTHGFDRNRFFRVGHSDTANAGRALASRGIVVLQVEEPSAWDDTPMNLVKSGLDVYVAAIDELASSGTIDAERVGISGYSFTGLTVATSITRAPKRFAAAVIANSDPLTMTGYYSYVDSPLQGLTESDIIGAAPIDDGLQVWFDKSPSMSTSSISAPVLMSATDPMHLLSLWDFYAALRYQKKAVELQYIRSGKHNIEKPLHKIAHQEMIVDWFDFWLNSHQDSDPGKADQYLRWREMRARPE